MPALDAAAAFEKFKNLLCSERSFEVLLCGNGKASQKPFAESLVNLPLWAATFRK